jgi:hypothetical protein
VHLAIQRGVIGPLREGGMEGSGVRRGEEGGEGIRGRGGDSRVASPTAASGSSAAPTPTPLPPGRLLVFFFLFLPGLGGNDYRSTQFLIP